MIHTALYGPLPPIWDFLDKRSNETLHLLRLEEFADIVNGCAVDALMRNSFAILCIVTMVHYLNLKTREIHKTLQNAPGQLTRTISSSEDNSCWHNCS